MAIGSIEDTAPPFVDAAELATFLRVDERHVAALRQRGHLPPAVRFGRSVRWPRRAIDR